MMLNIDGLLGRIFLDLRGAEALWPFLWLEQWVHAGNAATLGLGRLRLNW